MPGVTRPEVFRYEDFYELPDQFPAVVTKKVLGLRVRKNDGAGLVRHEHTVRGKFKQSLEQTAGVDTEDLVGRFSTHVAAPEFGGDAPGRSGCQVCCTDTYPQQRTESRLD